MPAISMFYGVIVYLYFYDNERNYLPHIHVRYQGMKASISICDGELIEGSIPPAKLRLVQAWVEIHREELMADWELAVNGEQPFKIPPLQ